MDSARAGGMALFTLPVDPSLVPPGGGGGVEVRNVGTTNTDYSL